MFKYFCSKESFSEAFFSKKDFSFLYNATKLNFEDKRLIKDVFRCCPNPKIVLNDMCLWMSKLLAIKTKERIYIKYFSLNNSIKCILNEFKIKKAVIYPENIEIKDDNSTTLDNFVINKKIGPIIYIIEK